jgi:hypothetical protein
MDAFRRRFRAEYFRAMRRRFGHGTRDTDDGVHLVLKAGGCDPPGAAKSETTERLLCPEAVRRTERHAGRRALVREAGLKGHF